MDFFNKTRIVSAITQPPSASINILLCYFIYDTLTTSHPLFGQGRSGVFTNVINLQILRNTEHINNKRSKMS